MDPNQQVFTIGLGVFHHHVKIAALVKDSGVYKLIFVIELGSQSVPMKKLIIGVSGLRILVEILHVGMGRRAIQVRIVFLDVFSVVAFGTR
jgi:hypothetical protein